MIEPKIVKVLIAIPNMGYAPTEAYGNRLVNFMYMGNLQTEQRVYHEMIELIKKEDLDLADYLGRKFKEKSSIIKDENEHEMFKFFFVNIGRLFTPAAREEAAEMAVREEMDYLFFIDDDMICPDDLFLKLYRHHRIADIVCPLAFTRNFPHKPVLYQCIKGWDPIHQSDYFINNVMMNYPKDKLVRADACGFGAALINTWVLKKMPKPYFMSSCGTGEDILFCYNADKVGARIYMDTSVKLGHVGNPIIVTEEYRDKIMKMTDPLAEKKFAHFKDSEAVTIIGDK